MTPQQLPDRPDLEQLKRQAKDLLRAAREGDAASLGRFRALPAFAGHTDSELARARLALHDAQSVVAREHGLPSWNRLREQVEESRLDLAAAATAFVEAATDGRAERAARLLERHPRVARASFHAALVLGDPAVVERRLDEQPGLATEAGGPRGWQPLLYVCHTAPGFGPTDRPDGLVEIARLLLDAGADPNARYPWPHHGVHRAVLWGAARVTRHLPLVALLLEAGADPNDGVTLPLSAGAGDLPVLDLLSRYGADPNQPWATDGSSALYSILTWGREPVGVRWLLQHGADPNTAFRENGETPMHVVARRWDVMTVALLAEHGADLEVRRADGRTPYAVAELSGNRGMARWLAGRGVATDLSDVDRLVAACSMGDRATVDALLASHPDLVGEIAPVHYLAWYEAADRGDTVALETMLACGFDPARPDDEIGKTALHCAAMAGWPDAVRLLLAHGAPVSVRDREFDGTPLVWAAEAARGGRAGGGRDHTAVARLLLEAGSSLEWESPTDEPAEGLGAVLAEWGRAFGTPSERPGPGARPVDAAPDRSSTG